MQKKALHLSLLMKRVATNIRSLRGLFLSLSLLWALLLTSQAALASTFISPTPTTHSSSELPAYSDQQNEGQAFKQGLLYLSEDATPSVLMINLQQATAIATKASFAFPTDEAIPPYAARAPGVSFLSKFFPTSIQPKAP